MSTTAVELGTVLDFFNGKAPPNDEDGDFVVYGSNGTIGKAKSTNHENAIILGRVGAYCGSVEFCDEKFWASDNTIVVKTKDGFDLKYMYYRLKSFPLRSYAGGAAQPLLTQTILRGVRLPVVKDKNRQAKIASILSAYDDLIENNRRRIQLLEQAARLLYKEWFVHLRFPGHEHTPIIDGVPEGWEKTTAFEVMDVLSGGTPKTTNPSYWDGHIPFFTPKDATDFAYAHDTEKSITEAGLKNCNSNLYPKDTVFITARGTVGKINLAQCPMAMNQSCYALVAHPPLNQHFLYFALVDGVEQFRSRAVGAVFDAIVRDTFKLIPFVVPDEKLITAFMEHVSPMLAQIDNLSGQVRSLRKARDLLLPKLMNGEVAV